MVQVLTGGLQRCSICRRAGRRPNRSVWRWSPPSTTWTEGCGRLTAGLRLTTTASCADRASRVESNQTRGDHLDAPAQDEPDELGTVRWPDEPGDEPPLGGGSGPPDALSLTARATKAADGAVLWSPAGNLRPWRPPLRPLATSGCSTPSSICASAVVLSSPRPRSTAASARPMTTGRSELSCSATSGRPGGGR